MNLFYPLIVSLCYFELVFILSLPMISYVKYRTLAIMFSLLGSLIWISILVSGWDNFLNGLIEFSSVDGSLVELIIFLIIISWDSMVLMGILLIDFIPKRQTISSPVDTNKYAFLVVCHNSSDRIDATLRELAKAQAKIFVADNGSKTREIEIAARICLTYNAVHLIIARGNKTLAQFFALNHISANNPEVEYIVALDDDISLPTNWDWQILESYFSDPNVDGICFPLTANNRITYISESQHLEYMLAGRSRLAQARLGSTLFASGGFAAYRKDPFLRVLEHHNSMFQGEDLQIGILLQRFFPGYRIVTCPEIEVPTDVPVHFYHTKPCDCGEASLFKQRVTSWDPARFWFFWIELRLAFTTRYPILSLSILLESIQLLSEHVAPIYFLIYLVLNPLGVIRGTILGLFWTTPMLLLIYLRYYIGKVDLYTVAGFNLGYKIACLGIRLCSLVYFYSVFLRRQKRKKSILKQVFESPGMRIDLQNVTWDQ